MSAYGLISTPNGGSVRVVSNETDYPAQPRPFHRRRADRRFRAAGGGLRRISRGARIIQYELASRLPAADPGYERAPRPDAYDDQLSPDARRVERADVRARAPGQDCNAGSYPPCALHESSRRTRRSLWAVVCTRQVPDGRDGLLPTTPGCADRTLIQFRTVIVNGCCETTPGTTCGWFPGSDRRAGRPIPDPRFRNGDLSCGVILEPE